MKRNIRIIEVVALLALCALFFSNRNPTPAPKPSPLKLFSCTNRFENPRAQKFFNDAQSIESKQPRAALKLLDEAIQLEPNNPVGYFHRALALGKLKRYPEAIVSENQAILLEPGFAGALNGRAYHRAFLNSREEALAGLQDVELALQLESGISTYYDTRGYLLLKLERTDEALVDFDKAVNGDASVDHLAHRAEAYRKLGRTDEAERDERSARSHH